MVQQAVADQSHVTAAQMRPARVHRHQQTQRGGLVRDMHSHIAEAQEKLQPQQPLLYALPWR